MNTTPGMRALHEALIAARTAEETMQGAVKLYGATPPAEAEKYHALAHAALDTWLDATRGAHRAFAEAVRNGGRL